MEMRSIGPVRRITVDLPTVRVSGGATSAGTGSAATLAGAWASAGKAATSGRGCPARARPEQGRGRRRT
jgi:hypothetical protein